MGTVAGKIWCRERLLLSIEKQSDGSLVRVQFQPGSNTAEKTTFVPEEDPHLLAEARMKYSLAYKGGYELRTEATMMCGHTQHRLEQKY